jgi:hypothetical protein
VVVMVLLILNRVLREWEKVAQAKVTTE